MPVALWSFSPIRCIECGGPVVTMTSTGCAFRYFFRKRTDGFTQPTRGSGTKRLPRIQRLRRCFQVFFPEEISVTSRPAFLPISFL